ncbi:hypothetical protein HID58_061508 [Brassica napus]|uniref:Uncharacterized protein n=1 Tax=Brassica napus TaxID=3708 RepID=A0ABQ7ZZD0_BRANA|nr:hypothetical protein HID58_061508 [Brassica napus]
MEFLHNSTFGKIMAVEENLQFSAHATFGVDGCKAITPCILPDAAKQLDHLILDHGKEQSQQLSLAPGPDFSDYLVLAAHRTKRPNILRAFKPYRGGWIITNNHQ